jgi:predicted outer membrane repeat protein
MRALLLAGLSLILASVGHATIFHVNADGTGDYPTIRDAMYACSDGDTVELADGVYTGYGNRDLVYAGTALTIRSASGDPLSCIIDCQGSETSQHRGFKFDPGVGRESVLEGVSIINGCMLGQPMPPHGDNQGAAIRCKYASPTIRNCRFEHNTTDSWFAWGTGGAVFCIEESSPLIEDCVFFENTSGLGGGMRCLRSDAVVIGCTFESNHAGSEGGGLSCWFCDASVTDCVFVDNTTADGGGLSSVYATVRVRDCLFSGNTASETGGAVYAKYANTLEFSDCRFEANFSNDGGGAFYSRGNNEGLSILLTEVEIVGNSTGETGAAMKVRETVVDLRGSLIAGNTAEAGGVLCAYHNSELNLANTTVADNEITGTPADAGALRVSESSTATAARSILAGNTWCSAVSCGVDASAALSCCDAFGNSEGDWVGCIADQLGVDGNFHSNPLFCLGENPDAPYTLHQGSPCLPDGSPCGELVGALGDGCDPVTVVRDVSWGAVKALFR